MANFSDVEKNADGTTSWTHKEGDEYIVTGRDHTGRRIAISHATWINTRATRCYRNVRVWLVRQGRRKLLATVTN